MKQQIIGALIVLGIPVVLWACQFAYVYVQVSFFSEEARQRRRLLGPNPIFLLLGFLLVVFSAVTGILLGILRLVLHVPVLILPIWLALGCLFLWLVLLVQIGVRRASARKLLRRCEAMPAYGDLWRERQRKVQYWARGLSYWRRHYWISLGLPWVINASGVLAWILISKPSGSYISFCRELSWIVFVGSLLTDLYLAAFFLRPKTIEYKKRMGF